MSIMSILAAGGGKPKVDLVIATNTNNYDVYANRGGGYVAGVTDLTVTVNSGVIVGSTSTGAYAMTVSSSFAAGDTVTIINNGTIVGAGGAGGTGVPDGNGNPGSVGGNALSISRATSIANNGTVAGGGGGGGAGGGGSFLSGKTQNNTPGGAGGTGAGIGAATGGSGGGTNAAPGGAGGGRGSSGSAGSYNGYNGRTGGGGGGAGFYAVGNANITWTATGTRLGNVS